MDLHKIIEVKEFSDIHEVNKLLNEGWVLLSLGFVDEGVPGYQYHKYSIGLPKSVKESERIRSTLGF